VVDPPPTDPNQPLWIRFWHHDVDDPSSNQAPVDDEWFYTDNRALGGVQMAGQGGGIYSEVPVSATGQAASVFGDTSCWAILRGIRKQCYVRQFHLLELWVFQPA